MQVHNLSRGGRSSMPCKRATDLGVDSLARELLKSSMRTCIIKVACSGAQLVHMHLCSRNLSKSQAQADSVLAPAILVQPLTSPAAVKQHP